MKSFLLFFFLSISIFSFAQDLLVNGDFEGENICTEFHVNCSPEGWISTSDAFNNFFKVPGLAHSGEHCVTIEAGNSKKQYNRSYLRTQLLCQLRRGNRYRLEFYVRSRHDILDSVGIYFTPYDFLFEKQVRYKITPSVFLTDAQLPPRGGDTTWQKISIDYIASGTELYLTLGNFSKSDIPGPTHIPLENNFFVFFDDISLVPENVNEKICNDWRATKDEIYDLHARHQFLDVYIKRHSGDLPAPPEVSKTRIEKIDSIILPDIFFEVNQSQLSKKSFHLLDSLSAILINSQIDSLVIEGHTDNTGTTEFNERLANDRALSIASYLKEKLFPKKEILIARGWGSQRPLGDNRTPVGRQSNRRVEIFIYIRQ
jgi:outer membrane protein OmpA-like peptidoglycan-associated protein